MTVLNQGGPGIHKLWLVQSFQQRRRRLVRVAQTVSYNVRTEAVSFKQRQFVQVPRQAQAGHGSGRLWRLARQKKCEDHGGCFRYGPREAVGPSASWRVLAATTSDDGA